MDELQSVSSIQESKAALARLIVDSPDFSRLESMLSDFNLFEAIGMERQELRHSTLLAFLLSPKKNHGLGDRFLKKFLTASLTHNALSSLSAIDIDLADLADAEVRREWRHIDLLICSNSNKWVIAVENKVDSGEHSNQLQRYEDIIETEFPRCEKKAFIYLTREGDRASRPRWQSLGYSTVADTIEDVVAEQVVPTNSDIQVLIRHYVDLIRRYIVSDSEIAQLCHKIYRQHHQALNLIYEHRPDLQLEIADFLKTLIEEENGIELEDSNKFYIRFVSTAWNKALIKKTCSRRWTDSGRFVMFEFFNYTDRLELKLTIAPGKYEEKKAIGDAIKGLNILGSIDSQYKEDGWSPLFCQTILTSSDYFEESFDSVQKKINEFWNDFTKKEASQICTAFCEAELSEDREPLYV